MGAKLGVCWFGLMGARRPRALASSQGDGKSFGGVGLQTVTDTPSLLSQVPAGPRINLQKPFHNFSNSSDELGLRRRIQCGKGRAKAEGN